jgi:hypothetical protein
MADYTIQIIAKITPAVNSKELQEALNYADVLKRLAGTLERLSLLEPAAEGKKYPKDRIIVTNVTVV